MKIVWATLPNLKKSLELDVCHAKPWMGDGFLPTICHATWPKRMDPSGAQLLHAAEGQSFDLSQMRFLSNQRHPYAIHTR